MRTRRFTEKTARRVAYSLMAWFLLSVLAAVFDPTFWPMATMAGLAAGLWNGRLAEATAAKKGTGIRVAE